MCFSSHISIPNFNCASQFLTKLCQCLGPFLTRSYSYLGHSSCLESLYLLSLYDELSAAVDGGVGELGLMTLGNQGSSELQKGRNQNRDPPSPNRDEDPCLGSEDPPQLREELPRTYTVRFIIRNIKNIIPQSIPVGARRILTSWHCSAPFWSSFDAI